MKLNFNPIINYRSKGQVHNVVCVNLIHIDRIGDESGLISRCKHP